MGVWYGCGGIGVYGLGALLERFGGGCMAAPCGKGEGALAS